MADFPLAKPTAGSTGWDAQLNNNFDILSKTAAKAWINFDGTGSIAIRSAYNVSSIADNGVGLYTINFYDPMPNSNYSVLGMGARTSQGTPCIGIGDAGLLSGSVQIRAATTVLVDPSTVCFVAFSQQP